MWPSLFKYLLVSVVSCTGGGIAEILEGGCAASLKTLRRAETDDERERERRDKEKREAEKERMKDEEEKIVCVGDGNEKRRKRRKGEKQKRASGGVGCFFSVALGRLCHSVLAFPN